MAKCKYCGAEIKWIRLKSGKNMPCDPEPVGYRCVEGAKETVVTAKGVVLTCETVGQRNRDTIIDGFGYVPHWATCAGGID